MKDSKFSKNDVVTISKDSQYYGRRGDSSNPSKVPGLIVTFNHGRKDHFRVVWPGGTTNTYTESDLELWEFPEPELIDKKRKELIKRIPKVEDLVPKRLNVGDLSEVKSLKELNLTEGELIHRLMRYEIAVRRLDEAFKIILDKEIKEDELSDDKEKTKKSGTSEDDYSWQVVDTPVQEFFRGATNQETEETQRDLSEAVLERIRRRRDL